MAFLTEFHIEYKKYDTEISYKEMKSLIGSIENDLHKGFIRTETDKISISNNEYNLLISLLPQKNVIEIDEIPEYRTSIHDFEKSEEEKQEERDFYHAELEKEVETEKINKNKIENYMPKLNKTCPRCNGTGKVNFSYANGICFKCMGTGKIQTMKNKQGGKREGSGRHKLPNPKNKKISVSFSEADYLKLKKFYPKYGELSKVIAELAIIEYLS